MRGRVRWILCLASLLAALCGLVLIWNPGPRCSSAEQDAQRGIDGKATPTGVTEALQSPTPQDGGSSRSAVVPDVATPLDVSVEPALVLKFVDVHGAAVAAVRAHWLDSEETASNISNDAGVIVMRHTMRLARAPQVGSTTGALDRVLCEKDEYQPVVLVNTGTTTSPTRPRVVRLQRAPNLVVVVSGISDTERGRCMVRVSTSMRNLLAREDQEIVERLQSRGPTSFSVRRSTVPGRSQVLWNGLGAKDWTEPLGSGFSAMFRGLPSGVPLHVDVLMEGNVIGRLGDTVALQAGEELRVDVVASMPRECAFQLQQDDGRPASNASVWLSSAKTSRQYCYWGTQGADRRGSADLTGVVTFAGLTPGEYFVGCGRDSNLPAPVVENGERNVFVGVRVTVGPDTTASAPILVRMPTGGVIGGFVVQGNQVCSNSEVLLSSPFVEGTCTRATDPSGSFLFSGCMDAQHSLRARVKGTKAWATVNADLGRVDHVLEIMPTQPLLVRIGRKDGACISSEELVVRFNRAAGVVEQRQLGPEAMTFMLEVASGVPEAIVVTQGVCIGVGSSDQSVGQEDGSRAMDVTLEPGCVLTVAGRASGRTVGVHVQGPGGMRLLGASVQAGSRKAMVVPRVPLTLMWTLGEGRSIETAVDVRDEESVTVQCPP